MKTRNFQSEKSEDDYETVGRGNDCGDIFYGIDFFRTKIEAEIFVLTVNRYTEKFAYAIDPNPNTMSSDEINMRDVQESSEIDIAFSVLEEMHEKGFKFFR